MRMRMLGLVLVRTILQVAAGNFFPKYARASGVAKRAHLRDLEPQYSHADRSPLPVAIKSRDERAGPHAAAVG